MSQHLLVGITGILALGVGAHWIAWRLRLPPILLLLTVGVVAGPVTGFIHPRALLGNLLTPIVSSSVALILFEGGLRLKVSELARIGNVVRNLVLIGATVTWIVTALAARYVLRLDDGLAILVGAILVVSGPTVIAPLLRYVRPSTTIASVLRWESILIDPLGAVLAVLVYEALALGPIEQATARAAAIFIRIIFAGVVVGAGGAVMMIQPLKRYWIPDFLQNAVTLAAVVGVFTASNVLARDSGLLAVTIMGITLANQKQAPVRHIMEFKESLSILLVSSLFIVIASELKYRDFRYIGLRSLLFLAILILVARPLAVAISTIRSSLNWRERLYLACMCPRGVVAASVMSVFALRLAGPGDTQAAQLVPLAFVVVMGTVIIYGLAAAPMAHALKLALPNPQGTLIAGAGPVAQAIARSVHEQGFPTLLVDTNRANVNDAQLSGIPAYYGSILSEDLVDRIEMHGIGRLLALTSNDEVNSLAALHFIEIFGRAAVFQLPPQHTDESRRQSVAPHLRGRLLFGEGCTHAWLREQLEAGGVIKTTALTEAFDYRAFQARHGGAAVPLFLVSEGGSLNVFTTDQPLTPRPGQSIISLIPSG
ncbi:MAG TPA: cation:proton antiporter [Armatimonadota bacterium]|nr:cation:proton antiporter [Armatimonadota bacterium]